MGSTFKAWINILFSLSGQSNLHACKPAVPHFNSTPSPPPWWVEMLLVEAWLVWDWAGDPLDWPL